MKFSISIGKILSGKKLFVGLFILFIVYFNKAFSQCSASIVYTTANTNNVLKGCAPFSVSFKDPNTAFSRTWDFGDGKPISTSTSPFHVFDAGVLGDTTYTVTLTKNCNGSPATEVIVTVYARPKVDFKVDTTSVCAITDQANFTNLSDDGTSDWSFGDNTSSAVRNPSKTYSVGGQYDVQLTLTNAKGCQSTKSYTKMMTVNSLPSPDFTLDNYSGCAPLNVVITNTTDTSAVRIKKWEWLLDNGSAIDTSSNPASVSYKTPGNKQLKLTVTSILGCKSTTLNGLHVITSPSSEFLINPLTICTSDSSQLTYQGAAGPTALYTWNLSGGTAKPGSGKGPHWLKWVKGGIKTIDLTVMDSTCFSTTSKTITVLISPVISLATTFDTICTGEEISFTATPESLVDYKFYKNGSIIQSSVVNTYTSDNINDGDNFFVVASDLKGCNSKPSKIKPIKVKDKPVVTLSYDQIDTIICKNDPVIFIGNPTKFKQYTFYNYSESLQSGLSASLTTSTLEDNDSIFVEATNLNGCSKTSSNAYIMKVVAPLTKPVVNCANSTNSSITFTWDTIQGATGYEVSINGGGFIASSGNYNHVLNGLNSGDTAKILVRALGSFSCGNSLLSIQKACAAAFCTRMPLVYEPYYSICKGERVNLMISGFTSSNYSLKWNNGNIKRDTSYQLTPNSDTEIPVSIIDSTQIATCSSLDLIFKIKVKALPTVTLTSSIPSTICEGNKTVLTASPATYDSYAFYNGNVLVQKNWKNTVKIDKIYNGLPLKVIASEKGCSSTSNSIVNNVVKPLNQPVVNCGTSTTSSIEFRWDAIVGATGYQVSVDGANWVDPSSGNNGLKHILNGLSPGSASYISVKALGSTICGNSEVSLQASCFTSPCTAISFNTQNTQSICEGSTVNLNVSSISIPNYAISWNKTSFSKVTTFATKPKKDTTISVIVKNLSETNCPFASKFIRINVLKQPNVTLNLEPSINCYGDSITLIASPVDYEMYRFYNGSALLNSGYSNVLKTSKLKDGALLKVVARNGSCTDTSNNIPINVDVPLERPIINSGNITNSSIEFVWDAVPNATGYMISVNGTAYTYPSSGSLGRLHLITGLGMHEMRYAKVIALGNGACGNSFESDTIKRYTTSHSDSSCTAIQYDITPHTSICEGDSFTTKITNLNNASSLVRWDLLPEDVLLDYVASPVLTDTVKVSVRRTDEPLCPAVTKFVRVTVNVKPTVSLSTSISNDSICESEEVIFTALPNGYANYKFIDQTTQLQSSNSNEFAINQITNSVKVEVIVTDDIGCTGSSLIVPITVVPKPVLNLTSNAVNSGVCNGSNLSVSASPSGYALYKFYDNGTEVQSNTTTTYLQNAITKSYLITANAVHAFGCVGDKTTPLNIQLFNLPVINLVSSDSDNSICDGQNISVTATPSNMVLYKFFEGVLSVQNSASDTKTYTTLSNNKSIYVVATDLNTCVSKPSNTVSITVNPNPVMSSSNLQIICSGNEVNIPLTSVVPSNYSWVAADNTLINGESVNVQSTAILKDSLKSISTGQEIVNYQIIPTSLVGCVGDPQNVQVKVNPTPIILNRVDTICSGLAFNLLPIHSNPTIQTVIPIGTTYTWATPVISIPNTISGSSAQSISKPSISQQLVNSTNVASNVLYTITPKSGTTGSCVGKPFNLRVEVSPTPSIQSYINDSICSNTIFEKNPINGSPNATTIVPPGTTYTWNLPVSTPNGSIQGGATESIGATTISQLLTNNTLNLGLVNYIVTPKAGKCIGTNFNIPIVVKPLPNITTNLIKSQCSNTDVAVQLTSDIIANYTWKGSTNSAVIGTSTTLKNTDLINDILVNQSNVPQSITYTITPISTYNCQGIVKDLVVTVNPTPKVNDISVSLCDEDSLIVNLIDGQNGNIIPLNSSYSWNSPTILPIDSITGFSAQTIPGLFIKQKLYTTSVSGSLIYTITPISGDLGNCVGNPFKINVALHPVPNPIISADVEGICKGVSAEITTILDETNNPNTVYTWNTGQKTKNISVKPTSTIDYKLTAESNGCTSLIDSIRIIVDDKIPNVNAGEDFVLCRGDSAMLTAVGGKSYVWDETPGIAQLLIANPKVAPYITTTYKVTATNDYCTKSDEIKVIIDRCLKELPTKIPQVFTPNQDGANDVWEIIDIDYFTKSSLLVFNRWGSIVYESGPYLNEWDGKNKNGNELPDGTYYYSLDLGNGHDPYKGFVVITR